MSVNRLSLDPVAATRTGTARRRAAPARRGPAAVLALQRSAGNRAVSGLLQRASYGPKASGAPATWSTDVTKALAGTAADRFALVASALTGVTVVDKTAASAGDASVDHKHLVEYTSSSPTVSYDDGLNAKKGRANDAGFTRNPGGKSFVVLGPKALRDSDFFFTRLIVDHEFDHVRQTKAGSKLSGNDSEVDAWTSTFVAQFHRSYRIEESGTTCYIDDYQTFSQLQGYYEKADVADAVKKDAVKRIEDYWNSTLKPDPMSAAVFKFWLHKTIKTGSYKALATTINDDLKLVNPADELKTTRQLDCAAVKKATYPTPTAVTPP